MPRSPRVPSYRLHRPSGQAVVTLSGRDHYLGAYGSPESRDLYERLIAEWLAAGRSARVERSPDLTVSEVIAAYLAFARQRHAGSQLDRIERSLGAVRRLYGASPAREFRGRALKAARQAIVEQGYNRRHVNHRVSCIKAAWRWALSEELIPAECVQSVLAVAGLRAGESDAPEPEEVPPVPVEDVLATVPHLSGFLGDVALVQLYAGMRPGEALAMRGDEIDRSRPDLWVWRPVQHKTAWRGHRRQVYLGPRAIAVASQYLRRECPLCGVQGRTGALAFRGGLCGPCADRADEEGVCGPWREILLSTGYLFSPRQAQEERFARLRAARRSRVQPSQRCRAKPSPARSPGERYNRESYSRAVQRAAQAAGVPHWHPHQLRHTAATLIASEAGIETARIFLGHRSLDVTRIYAADDLERVAAVVRRVG